MKKTNDIVTIAKNEFVVSDKAKVILKSYTQEIQKKYRLNRKAQKELLNALRDVLLAMQTKKQAQISEKIAKQAIEMVGTTYEESSKIKKYSSKVIRWIKDTLKNLLIALLTEKTRKRIYYTLAFIMLLPIGLIISSFSVFNPVYDQSNNGRSSYESTLGYIMPGEYAYSTDYDNPVITVPNNDAEFALAMSFSILLSILFFALAHRSKQTKYILALLIVIGVSYYGAAENSRIAMETAVNNNQQLIFGPPGDIKRDVHDYDKLLACRTSINYVTGYDAGKIYYALKDEGFVLEKELANNGGYQTPSREDICVAYNDLRKTYPDESIVLQEYVRDKQGETRPHDLEESYGVHSNGKRSRYNEFKYGFFVKK